MLLALRSLWEASAVVVAATTTAAGRVHYEKRRYGIPGPAWPDADFIPNGRQAQRQEEEELAVLLSALM